MVGAIAMDAERTFARSRDRPATARRSIAPTTSQPPGRPVSSTWPRTEGATQRAGRLHPLSTITTGKASTKPDEHGQRPPPQQPRLANHHDNPVSQQQKQPDEVKRTERGDAQRIGDTAPAAGRSSIRTKNRVVAAATRTKNAYGHACWAYLVLMGRAAMIRPEMSPARADAIRVPTRATNAAAAAIATTEGPRKATSESPKISVQTLTTALYRAGVASGPGS